MNYDLEELKRAAGWLLRHLNSGYEPEPRAIPILSTATKDGHQHLLIAIRLRVRIPDEVPVFLRRNP